MFFCCLHNKMLMIQHVDLWISFSDHIIPNMAKYQSMEVTLSKRTARCHTKMVGPFDCISLPGWCVDRITCCDYVRCFWDVHVVRWWIIDEYGCIMGDMLYIYYIAKYTMFCSFSLEGGRGKRVHRKAPVFVHLQLPIPTFLFVGGLSVTLQKEIVPFLVGDTWFFYSSWRFLISAFYG